MKPQSPCYRCSNRVPGCHEECNKYKIFKIELEEYNQLVKKNKYQEFLQNDKPFYKSRRKYK